MEQRSESQVLYTSTPKVEIVSGGTPQLKKQPWGKLLTLVGYAATFGSAVPVGYCIGDINSPASYMRAWCNETLIERYDFHITSGGLDILWSTIVSIFLVGGAIGSLGGAGAADKFGRKGCFLISGLLFLVGALLFLFCRLASSVEMLLLGRFFVGLASGLTTASLPMYLTECAPLALRGTLGVMCAVGINAGVVVGQLFSLRHIFGTANHWHYGLSFYIVLVIVCYVPSYYFPESPKWLYIVKKDKESAKRELRRLRGANQMTQIKKEMEDMEAEASAKMQTSSFGAVLRDSNLTLPLVIVCCFHGGQQLSGINAIFYYSVSIFERAGLSTTDAEWANVGAGTLNLVTSFLGPYLMANVNRRPIMQFSCFVCSMFLLAFAFILHFIDYASWFAIACIVCIFCYIFFYQFGLGPIPYFIGSGCFLITGVLFVMGAILFMFCRMASSVEMLLLGRLCVGLASGLTTTSLPMYLSELAPLALRGGRIHNALRGTLGVFCAVGVTGGVVVGQVFSLRHVFGTADHWHYGLSFYIVLIIFCYAPSYFFPESPKWLYVIKQDRESAKRELQRLRGSDQKAQIQKEIEDMEAESSAKTQTASFREVLGDSSLLMPLIIVCCFHGGQQLTGINAIFYYSVSIFERAGLSTPNAEWANLGAGTVNLLTSLLGPYLMANVDRRPIMQFSCFVCSIFLFAFAFILHFIDYISWFPILCIVCIFCYIFFFQFGLGPIPYFIGSGCFLITGFLFVMGAILFMFCRMASSVEMLLLGRLCVGLASGLTTASLPMYLSELAPLALRGTLGVFCAVGVTGGVVVGQVFSLRHVFGTADHWHYGLSFYIVLIIVCYAPSYYFPESPKWLYVIKQDRECAKRELQRLRGADQKALIQKEIEDMEAEAGAKMQTASFCAVLGDSRLLMPLIIVCSFHGGQQLTGINAIFYYSVSIFERAGLSTTNAEWANLGAGTVNFLTSLLGPYLMANVDRRPIMQFSCFVCSIFLFAFAFILHFIDYISWFPILCIVCIFCYIFFFEFGLGPIPYFIGSEIFEVAPRPIGMAMGSLASWSCNFIIGMAFPTLQNAWGAFVFIPFSITCILLFLLTRFYLPETRGHDPSEVAPLISKGFSSKVR